MELEQIREIVNSPDFDLKEALLSHRDSLREKRNRLDQLLETVERSLAGLEGRIKMSDKEKFEGFKKQLIAENRGEVWPGSPGEVRRRCGGCVQCQAPRHV